MMEEFDNNRIYNKTQRLVSTLQSLQLQLSEGHFGPSNYLDVQFEIEDYKSFLNEAIVARQDFTEPYESEVQIWDAEAVPA